MSILRKRGKEKLRFRIVSQRVTSRDFRYLKRLFLESLNENLDKAKRLDDIYKLIQVFILYESTNPNTIKHLRSILDDNTLSYPTKPVPASAHSRKNVGCIMVFVKHLNEETRKRKDIKNTESYHKNGIFEELCHLVEQNGDGSICSSSYHTLGRLYRSRNQLNYGIEIIARLDTDRNHYEVFPMIISAYPNASIERLWRYFMAETPESYEKEYEGWKSKIPIEIAYARLITDTLRYINVLYVAEKVPKTKLSARNKELLHTLIRTGKLDVEKKKSLIEKDMGSAALTLIDSLDESIFKTSDTFFSVVLGLWKSLHLV